MSSIGTILLVLYFYTILPATLYFNWEYANECGFTKWLFLGQFVPTAQSCIWPYYAYKHYHQPTESDLDEFAEHKKNSDAALKKAFAFMCMVNSRLTVSDNNKPEMKRLIDQALSEAKLFDRDETRKMWPEFLARYESDYIGSLKLYSESLQDGDLNKFDTAGKLMMSYGMWLEAAKGSKKK